MDSTQEMFQAIQMATIALQDEHAKGAVVASVNGKPIYAGQVDAYLELFRKKNNIQDEDAWAARKDAIGMSYEGMLNQTVDYLVNFMLLDDLIAEEGIVVTEDDLEEQVKGAYDELGIVGVLTELAMQELSMEDYRSGIRNSLARIRLQEKVAEAKDPSDAEVLELLKEQKLVPKKAHLSEVSSALRSQAESALIQKKRGASFDRWFTQKRREADIVIGGLPGSVIDVLMGRDPLSQMAD